MLAPGGVAGVAHIRSQLRRAHGFREAGKHRILVGANQHHLAASRGIDVRGRNLRQDGAGALPDDPRFRVFRHRAFHHGEHGLVDRRIHDLPLPRLIPMLKGRQRPQAGKGGRQRIANR